MLAQMVGIVLGGVHAERARDHTHRCKGQRGECHHRKRRQIRRERGDEQRHGGEQEAHAVGALAADLVDGEGRDEQHEQAGKADDEALEVRLRDSVVIDRTHDARQPAGDRVGDQIGAEPQHPKRQGALEINALKQIAETAVRGDGGRDVAWNRRQRLLAVRGNVPLDLLHDPIGIFVASAAGEPARRFRQHPDHRQRQQHRQPAQDEHPLPAEIRHHEGADQGDRRQSDREHDLLQQDETAALRRFGELVDVGVGDRHLAAKTDALQEPQQQQRRVVLRQHAGKAHQRKQDDVGNHQRNAAIAFGKPARHDAADHLPGIADRNQHSDIGRLHLPQRNERRQHIGDGQRIKSIGKINAADDEPDLVVPG